MRSRATGRGESDPEHLRVLIANERRDRLAAVAALVTALGHEVIAREIHIDEVGNATGPEELDVALIGVGKNSDHALQLIGKIVHEAWCPVIALLHAPDADFVTEAAKRGVFAYVAVDDPGAWRNAIEIAFLRFAEFQQLRDAFERRALIERAKGILMERRSVGEGAAFELLRSQSRTMNRQIVDIAQGVVDGHALLPKKP
jgi:AmiR/NasT family two-component response regulator